METAEKIRLLLQIAEDALKFPETRSLSQAAIAEIKKIANEPWFDSVEPDEPHDEPHTEDEHHG